MSGGSVSTDLPTPGPWKLDWNVANGGVHPDYPDLRYVSVCHATDWKLRLTGYVRPADAHLIAAAPELLVFANAYRESLSSRRECDLDDIEMDLLNMADAAIAKAEGRANV